MHTEKCKAGNCGLLSEANRTMYMDEEGNFIEDMPHSNIDFERTPYNYNISPNDYTMEEIISLNEKWRGCKINPKKDNVMCYVDLTMPQKFGMPGHEILDTLVGKERMLYILNHEDVKAAADTFIREAKKSFMKQYGLEEEDICSAWVHFDESNFHCHLYFIPHVREKENVISDKDKDKAEELQQQLELSTHPKEFYEDTRMKYENKILRLEQKLSEKKSPVEQKKIEKSLKAVRSDLEKLLAKEGNEKEINKYAQTRHRAIKSELKKLTNETTKETVSVDKCITRDKLFKMHDIASDEISAALGFRVEMRTGESLWYDPQKYSKEEKEKALQAKGEKLQAEAETAYSKAEADYAKKEADAEVERLYYTNVEANKAQKRLEKIEKDNTSAELNNACLKAENKALTNEKALIRADIQKDKDIQNTLRDNLTAFFNNYYINEYNKAINRGDFDTMSRLAQQAFAKAELVDQYKRENKQLSNMNSVLTTESNKNKVFSDALNEKAKTYDEILLMFDDETLTNRDISEAIKFYALAKNDTETDSLLKTCNALDKIDAYNHKSYAQRNKSFMEKAENHNFNRFEEYDTRIRTMLKKSLTYEGRTDIYKGKDNLKSLWADIQTDNRNFWEKKKEKNKTAYEGYISLDKVFTAIVPQLIQTAINAIKSYIEMLKEQYNNQYENEYE